MSKTMQDYVVKKRMELDSRLHEKHNQVQFARQQVEHAFTFGVLSKDPVQFEEHENEYMRNLRILEGLERELRDIQKEALALTERQWKVRGK